MVIGMRTNNFQDTILEVVLLSLVFLRWCGGYHGRNSWPKQDDNLMNYEQKSKNLDQEHIYQEKARFELITRNRNKTWEQLVLMRLRDNVPRLSIYTLDIYSTLLVVQAMFKAVAWASSLLSLHSKLFKGCALRSKASLKQWLWPQITWLALQVELACTPNYPKAIPCASKYRQCFVTTS
jgi:hypothetical protein